MDFKKLSISQILQKGNHDLQLQNHKKLYEQKNKLKGFFLCVGEEGGEWGDTVLLITCQKLGHNLHLEIMCWKHNLSYVIFLY